MRKAKPESGPAANITHGTPAQTVLDIKLKNELFRGFIELMDNKKPKTSIVGKKNLPGLDDVANLPCFGGVIRDDIILVDIDKTAQSDTLYQIIKEKGVNSVIIQTGRGKHFYFKNTDVKKNRTACTLAIGIKADIKLGKSNSYGVLKLDTARQLLSNPDKIDYLPRWLIPVSKPKLNDDGEKFNFDFYGMEEGGRNQALFDYILELQRNGLANDEIKETIHIINDYVLGERLPDSELNTILRPDSFKKGQFFLKGKFLHYEFGEYIRANYHVIKIGGQLHFYSNGVYVSDIKQLEKVMIEEIKELTYRQRLEVVRHLEAFADETPESDIFKIPVANGLLNLKTGELEEFTPGFICKNKILTRYCAESGAAVEKFLNELSNYNASLKAVIEEMIGLCLVRSNSAQKLFVLVGSGANGKSTLLKLIIKMLGEKNVSAVELKELNDKFKTAELFGKLANIGDDISNEKIANSSFLKKLSSGERVNAERKGQSPFEFNCYATLIFSANDMPNINDLQDGLTRRLMFLPFNNIFKTNADFEQSLLTTANCEGLLTLAVAGLKRFLEKGFTDCELISAAGKEYEMDNNPIKAYIDIRGVDSFIGNTPASVYDEFSKWAELSGYKQAREYTQPRVTRQIKRLTGLTTKPKHITQYGKQKSIRVFATDI